MLKGLLRQHGASGWAGKLPILAAIVVTLAVAPTASAGEGRSIPGPVADEAPSQEATQTMVLAGGCFRGVQGVFQRVKGVTRAVSGYAGGEQQTAVYEKVTSGTTGHAEAVQITFDPKQISYGRLLHIFFSVAHDPTQLDRQGPDIGSQYRSAIFPHC